ncbi:hypothetical protein JVX91_11305 [Pseudomonas sp. PDNC002]|nr:hypothetical protein JVX91_11305 [Pseudomonas sp. PDNC002]
MRNACVIGLLSLALGGCANLGPLGGNQVGQACSENLGQSVELQLNLAREMLDNGRAHAALANLDMLPQDSLEVRESRALALRRIGDPRALVEYRNLLNTCKAAEAHHGLGQIAMRGGNTVRAEEELGEAARLRPTDSAFRNDLGYALMRSGALERARFEFITAMELDDHDKLSATNLLSLLYLQDDDRQAKSLIQSVGLSADQVRAARDQADSLRPAAHAPVQPESVSYVDEPRDTPHADSMASAPAEARDAKLLVNAR